MSAPLEPFAGFLKQIDRDSTDRVARCILDTAFPLFWPADPTTEEWQKRIEAFQQRGADFVFEDVNAPRRFAGCWGLPRKRFFSLSADEHGDDQNTLVNELTAYLDPLRAGLLAFCDMGVPQALELFKQQYDPSAQAGPYLKFVIIGRPGAISPVIDALQEQDLIPQEPSNDQRRGRRLYSVHVPYFVVRRDIASVFDLRRPECQEYIVEEFFKKDTEQLTKVDRSGINKFVEALPILLHPDLGGGEPTGDNGLVVQALASFLRSRGAGALIYPSARSNVRTVVKSGSVESWRGWCLVDYTGSRDPLITESISFSSGWAKAMPKGTLVRYASNGEFAGSFEVEGREEWMREKIGEKEKEFLRLQESS